MTALRVAGVSKRFGSTLAVDDVSFDLGDHELLALVGPSGCGKSTMLRMIAGLEPIDAGSIILGEVVVDDGDRLVPPERRHVGLVFQEHALFPHLSVADNVAFGVRGDRARSRVAEMLDRVGLGAFGDRFPHELSGGERQRVALARALAPQPSLLLLDEPFASLDPNLRSQVRDEVVGVLRDSGTPAVFVTHDQSDALAIGDRIAVIRAGRVVQLATPEQVFHEPTDRFVAAFMGEANFVAATTVRALDGGAVPDGVPDDAILMMRPDDLSFHEAVDGDATIVATQFRGSLIAYTIELPTGERIVSVRSHTQRLPVGARVRPVVLPGHAPVVIEG